MNKNIYQHIVDKNISNILKLSSFMNEKQNIKSTFMVVPTSIEFYKDNLPNLVVITEGKVADLYTAKEFIKTEIITFLEKNEVIESD